MYNHLMSNKVGWLAVITYLIFVIIILLSWRNKKSILKLINLFKTPNNTTRVFHWVSNLTPMIFVITVFIVIIIYSNFNEVKEIALVLLAVILHQTPKSFYNFFILQTRGVQYKDICYLSKSKEFQKIVEYEKASISLISTISLLITYTLLLFTLQKYVDLLKEGEVSILFLVLFFLFIAIVVTIMMTAGLAALFKYRQKRIINKSS